VSFVQVLDVDLVEPGVVGIHGAEQASGADAAGAKQAEKTFETR